MKASWCLVKTKDGQVSGLRYDTPGVAVAHYVVAEHFGIDPSNVADTGHGYPDGEVVWRKDAIRGGRR